MCASPYRILESHRQVVSIDGRSSRDLLSLRELSNATFISWKSGWNVLYRDMYGDIPLGCYIMSRARITPTQRGDYGYISVNGDFIVEQNADFLRKKKFLRPRFSEMLTDCVEHQRLGEVVVLTSRCHNNFWHWMMDSLPKVLIAERCGFRGMYLVPPAHVAPWAAESLKLVGISECRLARLSGQPIEIERLYLPTYFCGYNAHVNRDFSREYREWILEGVSPRPSTCGRRIFVGRAESAPVRRMLNESELAHLLGKEGFEHIYFERLSLREQIKVAGETSVLVGGHGSGLTHLLFMAERSLVVELFPHNRQQTNDCFEALATIVPQRYRALESQAMREGDIEIDPDSLRRVLIEEFAI